MSDDLVTWLRAQLDEDERVARAIDEPEWEYLPALWDEIGIDAEAELRIGSRAVPVPGLDLDEQEHIARHDPASVLREVGATRRIIDACEPDYRDSLTNGDDTTELATEVLRLLALPYADRPGWREEWRV